MQAQTYWSRMYHAVGNCYTHATETPDEVEREFNDFKMYVKVETHQRHHDFGVVVGFVELDEDKQNRSSGHIILTDTDALTGLPSPVAITDTITLSDTGYSSLLVLFNDGTMNNEQRGFPLTLEMHPINTGGDVPGLELRLQCNGNVAFNIQLTPAQVTDFINFLDDAAHWQNLHNSFSGYFNRNDPLYMTPNGDTIHLDDRPSINDNEFDIPNQ